MVEKLVEMDARSRVTLPGHSGERFMAQEHEDGSILLVPAVVMSQAQYEYETNPELKSMLDQAMGSATVQRERPRRRTS